MTNYDKEIVGNTTLRKHDELGWELCMQEYTNKPPFYKTYTSRYSGPIELGGTGLQEIYDCMKRMIDRETADLERVKDNSTVLEIHKKVVGRYQEYADFLSSYISQGSKK